MSEFLEFRLEISYFRLAQIVLESRDRVFLADSMNESLSRFEIRLVSLYETSAKFR